jgi:hypothetical protein
LNKYVWAVHLSWYPGFEVDQNQVAERVGFEPTVVLPTHAFQACALNHSAISPAVYLQALNNDLQFDFLILQFDTERVKLSIAAP